MTCFAHVFTQNDTKLLQEVRPVTVGDEAGEHVVSSLTVTRQASTEGEQGSLSLSLSVCLSLSLSLSLSYTRAYLLTRTRARIHTHRAAAALPRVDRPGIRPAVCGV